MCTFKNLGKFGKPGKKFEKTSGNPEQSVYDNNKRLLNM